MEMLWSYRLVSCRKTSKKIRFVTFLRLQIHYAQQLGNGGQCHGLQKPYCRLWYSGHIVYRGQALYSLLTDVTEGIAGLAVLHGCLSRFYPLPKDWFRFSLKGNWHIDIVLGCLLFPLVNRLSQFNLDLLPLMSSMPIILSSVEQSILARVHCLLP